ncbi:MAG TPA: VOC family protein [Candidatus Binatia bacterium]|jgi:2,3-dihydroxybiphenyl 1,2-dioxygenase
MKIAALGYVGINATDAQAWARFGPEILGLRAAPAGEDGTVYLQMDERAYRLAVHPASTNGLAYIGWELPSALDLEQACVELEKAGLKPVRGSEEDCALRRVAALVKIADPYGNRLELFYGQLNICEAFQPARPIGGFVAGNLGLGHVVIGVPDLEAGKKFYTETLGFRLSDFVPDRLVFFHCNPRHHSIAFGKIGPGLRHIMLEVKTIDDVGKTFDLCQASGVPITKALGRHSNDRMFSFYMKCPAGFEIEYGTEGRLVDDATWSVQQVDRGSIWGHQRIAG